jgi:hypothetical protein
MVRRFNQYQNKAQKTQSTNVFVVGVHNFAGACASADGYSRVSLILISSFKKAAGTFSHAGNSASA